MERRGDLEAVDGEGPPFTSDGYFSLRNYDSASLSSFSLETPSLPRKLHAQEDTDSLVSTGTLVPEAIYLPPPGHCLVTHSDWDALNAQVWIPASVHFLSNCWWSWRFIGEVLTFCRFQSCVGRWVVWRLWRRSWRRNWTHRPTRLTSRWKDGIFYKKSNAVSVFISSSHFTDYDILCEERELVLDVLVNLCK